MVRPCEENERGAHSEKNVRCGHTGERRRGRPNLRWKDASFACKRDMTEVGLKEDNTTNRAEWKKKLISYTGDPRWRDKPGKKKKKLWQTVGHIINKSKIVSLQWYIFQIIIIQLLLMLKMDTFATFRKTNHTKPLTRFIFLHTNAGTWLPKRTSSKWRHTMLLHDGTKTRQIHNFLAYEKNARFHSNVCTSRPI